MPYWQQANPDMNTSGALRARDELRRHPEVKEALAEWWATAQRTVQLGGASYGGPQYDSTTLTRHQYGSTFKSPAKACPLPMPCRM